ncbi:MAG: arylsulfatase, partial [Bacteroidota bacterium]
MKYIWINALFLGCCLLSCQPSTPESPPPNILLILVDDMGYSDLGCYGGEITTPNLDALAAGGMRMTQFYNAARCCPTRASLLTGLYPHQAGMGHQNQDRGVPSYRGRIHPHTPNLAEVLQPQGYATYHVGKWHVGNEAASWPENRGFQRSLSLIEGAMSYFNAWPWARNQDTLEIRYDGESYQTPADFFATTTFSDTAISMLRKHDKEQPFFMYLAYNAPHWPLHVRPEDRDLYAGAYDQGWEAIRAARFERMQELGVLAKTATLSPMYPSIPAWESLDDSAQEAWSEKMELYAAVMHRLDLEVGKVFSALKAQEQWDNTLILFLSDNGACQEDPLGPWIVYPNEGEAGGPQSFPAYELPWANVSNVPYRLFKSFLHEGGMKTPFIAHWPDQIPAGTVQQQSVGHIIDLMPSLLAVSGASHPATFDGQSTVPLPGQSLWPSWEGAKQEREQALFWEHQFNRAMRDGPWKLVSAYRLPEQGRSDQWELYHLDDDPSELRNLADQYPKRVQQMAAQYEAWSEEVGVLGKEELPK